MDSSGSVPSVSNARPQQLVPRQITIEILGEDGLGSSQPVKITSFPVNTSPLKVVDFRHITMKSDMPAGTEMRIGSDNTIRTLVTPAGLAKAKTQLSKVIAKDMLAVPKEKMAEEQRNTLKTMTRPILPKTIQGEGGGDDGNVPMRIKQISRIGSSGISEKVNVIEVMPNTIAPTYASSYTRLSHQHLSSTPSSTTASNSPAVMSTGARRGRKKHSKKVYYAYVTESESESEMGRGNDRRRRKRRRDDDAFEEGAVITHRRSKRENLSQKLVEWGLIPGASRGAGAHGGEEYEEEMPPVVLHPKRRRIEELEELEPIIPGPPPKFVTVKTSGIQTKEARLPTYVTKATAMEVPVSGSLVSLNQLQPEQQMMQPIQFELPQVKPHSTVYALQLQLQEAMKAEALLGTTTTATSTIDMKLEPIVNETKVNPSLLHNPVAPPVSAQMSDLILSNIPATPVAAPKAPGDQKSGWIKKASSMLAPPLLAATHTTPVPPTMTPYTPKKRVDTMNKSLMCKPIMLTKATTSNLGRMHKQAQTDENIVEHRRTIAVPLPVPQLIPLPGFAMSMPALAPLPMPVVVPIPLPLPASRKNVEDLIKQLKDLRRETSGDLDPLELELLDIAEVIEETKTQEDIDQEIFNATIVRGVNDRFFEYPNPLLPAATTASGKMSGGAGSEDVLEMAMRMAADMPEDSRAHVPGTMESSRSELAMLGGVQSTVVAVKQPLPVNDTNMALKYSYALKAWRYWAEKKNEELSKLPTVARSKAKYLYPTDPLMCDSDNLNAGLTLFVKELLKPTGDAYSPDTIVLFCLGIQFYLKENSHPDNIFFDTPYQRFTDSLNELLSSYELRLNVQNMVICRVIEDHMWESLQLGCHSPQTLLNTLIYFNTKYFLLDTVQAHMNLSFVSIERSRENQMRKLSLRKTIPGREMKLITEEHLKQLENHEDSMKCPVKIFEFYLSKCPESVRNHQRLFYLCPDATAKPDSPYWYTPISLSAGAVTKMLNRARVVREVQIAKLEHMQI